MRFTTSTTMAKIDDKTVADYGITEAALMENAGQLTARHIRRKYLGSEASHVVVLAGKGHNGADGMVTARWLDKWGHDVTLRRLFSPDELEGLPRKQYRYLESVDSIGDGELTAESSLPGADLYIDALFGTGLEGDPRPPCDDVIRTLNDQPSPVVSIDIPSGLSGDDNLPYDPCVQADLTVTFGLPKLGMLLEPGYSFAGQLITQEIGFPESVIEDLAEQFHLITPGDVRNDLPVRFPTIHKGSAGRTTVVGGSENYPGAPFLVAQSASRIGSGLTSIAGPPLLKENQADGERDLIFPVDLPDLLSDPSAHENFLDRQNAVVIGPGLGRSTDRREGLERLIPRLSCPAVVDADGLNNLADDLSVFRRDVPIVLTPHPGEASRLLGTDVETVMNRPVDTARRLRDETEQVVVLKTSRPVVAHPGGAISVNVSGSPALAKAGSGDVLSGLIGGLLAQNLDPSPATCLALYLHGAAGRQAAMEHDTISVKSEDVIDHVPSAIDELEHEPRPDWFPVKFESLPQSVYRWNPFPN